MRNTLSLNISLLGAALALLVGTPPVRGQSSALSDVKGDASSAAAYLDLVRASITFDSVPGTFLFSMELAGPVPDAPSESFISWQWPLDTNTNQAPGGNQFEYLVTVRWSAGLFEGFLVDRIQNIQTPMAFLISKNTLNVTVGKTDLGNPSHFLWRPHSKLCPGACTTLTDRVPDAELALWPPPAPELMIEKAVILSWPANTADLVLETAASVTGPWTAVAPTPTVAGNQNTVVVRTSDAAALFRLRQP